MSPTAQQTASQQANAKSTASPSVVHRIANDLIALTRTSNQQQQPPPVSVNESISTFLTPVEQRILGGGNALSTLAETDEQPTLADNECKILSVEEYTLNQDPNPEVITKRTDQKIEYTQETAVRYLRPPTPPPPGDIIIRQASNVCTAPAPPLIIRQQPGRIETPAPLVIREAPPPPPPAPIKRKVITISGKRLPPPPRKVILERLPQLPGKPQPVVVERWLPYAQPKRRVIYQGPRHPDNVVAKPKNVIVQWEGVEANVTREVHHLGVVRADPTEYVSRYGAELKQSSELPQFVKDIRAPEGLTLAADAQPSDLTELVGDVDALALVDLNAEGLAEYTALLQKYFSKQQLPTPTSSRPSNASSNVLKTDSIVTASALSNTPN